MKTTILSAEEISSPPLKGIFGVRHGQVALLCAGMISSYLVRLNLSDGIVAMTNPSSNPKYPTLNWINSERGSLLGMFFYGYVVGTLPGGFVVTRLTPKVALSVSGVLTGILNMGFPYIAIQCGYHASCLTRVVSGVLQGVFVPGISLHISRWAAPEEKSQFTSIIYSGNSLGSFIMLCTGGYLAESSLGWPSIFYLSGAFILLWGIVCFSFLVESPSVHKTLTRQERVYIEGEDYASKSSSNLSLHVPWLQIFTSIPLWTAIITSFSFNWGYWTLQTMLPTYMEGVLNFEISEDGLLSSLPSIGMACGALGFPFLDKIMSRYFERSTAFYRKLWNSIAFYSNAVIFIILAFIQPEAATVVVILIMATTLSAGEYGGVSCSPVDLTNNFAGVVSGVHNCLSNTASLIAPMVAGFIISDNSNVKQWRTVFLIGGVLFFLGNTLFLMFSSSEIQPWNEPKPSPPIRTTRPAEEPEVSTTKL